jgi:UDP-N-acetylglucosamine--N-acetylmuramyl-(pentapeptide) pyrophosphoryl-undecaprenol N-acetylglucosamine transferase
VYPGLAVADALRSIADVDVVFAGTPRGLEARVIPDRGYRLELLDVVPIKGGGVARAVRGAAVAARETLRAVALVRRVRPLAVLSVGGYAAGPVSLAAAVLGVKLAILEPNSVVGFANRLLAPLAARAYVAWEETVPRFRKGRARVAGVPLRSGFAPQAYAPHGGAPRVLVMGGSQGAQALNERMPFAVARASEQVPGLEVMHQAVREAYAREKVERAIVAAYIEDVPREIARADVVIARAGAATVAEIAAVGRASILIPFPYAADDHQAKNAEALARKRGAVAVRQESADAVRIASELVRLLTDERARTKMADAARASGRPHAALEIARDLLDLIGVPASIPKPRLVNGATPSARSEAH